MKKKFKLILVFIFVIAVIAFLLLATDSLFNKSTIDTSSNTQQTDNKEKTVVAVVDGKEIYQETIDFLAKGEEISQKNTALVTGETPTEVDTDAILQKQIRNMVVLAEAERLGLTVSLEEAEEYTRDNYELVKEIGGQNYEVILDYMEAMNMTEDEYLEKATQTNRNMLTRGKLYEKFVEGKSGTNEELTAEYEKYVEELIEKADIEYTK